MSKTGIIADLHICKKAYYVTAFQKFLEDVKKLLDSHRDINKFLLLGDIFNNVNIDLEVVSMFNLLYNLLRFYNYDEIEGREIVCILGNHDYGIYERKQTTIAELLRSYGIHVIDSLEAIDLNAVKTLCIPWSKVKDVNGFYKEVYEDPLSKQHYDLVAGHHAIKPLKNIPWLDLEKLDATYAAFGHIHAHPDKAYLGSPIPNSKAEDKFRCPSNIMVVWSDDGKPKAEYCQLRQYVKFEDVELNDEIELNKFLDKASKETTDYQMLYVVRIPKALWRPDLDQNKFVYDVIFNDAEVEDKLSTSLMKLSDEATSINTLLEESLKKDLISEEDAEDLRAAAKLIGYIS